MQFSISAVVLAISTLAVAAPVTEEMTGMMDVSATKRGLNTQEHGGIKWPVPDGLTVKEAQAKCGDQAQLSCCNKATYAGDTTDVNSSIGSGLLSNLIGSGSGAQGAGIFDQCSQLHVQVAVLAGIPVQDILNQKCKQNIACCAGSASTASNDLVGAGLPCVALGSIL